MSITPSAIPPPIVSRDEWPFNTSTPEAHPDRSGHLPAIGIVTPSYNQGEFIEATIRSVLLQGYPHLQYYIEDGGSNDQSRDVIAHYADHLNGWVSEKDRGQSHAINKGMARLDGAEIVNWLNSDDYLMPGALWAIAREAQAHPQASVYIGAARRELRGEDVVRVHKHESVRLADVLQWHDKFLSQPASWFRLELYNKIGGLREDLSHCMDFDMWIRLFGAGAQAVCFDEVLVTTVHHDDAKTVKGRGRMYGESTAVLIENGYRDEAIAYVEKLYNEYHEATRVFRAIKKTAGGRSLLNFYNRHLKPGR